MEAQNMQSSEETLWRKLLVGGLCLVIILVPLFISLLSEENGGINSSETTVYLQNCFEKNRFMISPDNDFTSHSIALLEDGGKIFIQGLFCVFAVIILLSSVIRYHRKDLYPFAVAYSIYSMFIILANVGDYLLSWGLPSWYNRFMLWGRYVRALQGVLPMIIYVALFATLIYYIIKNVIVLSKRSV